MALKEWRNKTEEDIERYESSEEHYNRMLSEVEEVVRTDYPEDYQFLLRYQDVKVLIEGIVDQEVSRCRTRGES